MQLTSKTRQLGERVPLLVTSQRQPVEVVVPRELSLKLFATLPYLPRRPASPRPSPVANDPQQQHHRSQRERARHPSSKGGLVATLTRETKYQPDRTSERQNKEQVPHQKWPPNTPSQRPSKRSASSFARPRSTAPPRGTSSRPRGGGRVRLAPSHPSARSSKKHNHSPRVIPICRIATNSGHRIHLPPPPPLLPKRDKWTMEKTGLSRGRRKEGGGRGRRV